MAYVVRLNWFSFVVRNNVCVCVCREYNVGESKWKKQKKNQRTGKKEYGIVIVLI